MPFDVTLWTLLHLLVFVYWLGGDIGVFYSSLMLTDAKRSDEGRLMAAKILFDLDLAPRFCLLLTLPTGLALAQQKGWLELGWSVVALAFVIAFAWSFVVYTLHIRHQGTESLRRFDELARWGFCLALSVTGLAGIFKTLSIPTFLSWKLLILGFTVLMGLLVRRVLKPFGPAYVKLQSDGSTEEINRTIAKALSEARPFVMLIWIGLILAAALGVATPT